MVVLHMYCIWTLVPELLKKKKKEEKTKFCEGQT